MPIEQLNADKAELAYHICQQSHPVPWSFNVFKDCLAPPYFGFYLEQSAQIIGYYIGLKVVDEVTLMDIAVAENYRGFGHGHTLLSHCLTQVKLRDASTCWLEVRASNRSAIAMYTKYGFNTVETRKGYYQAVADESGVSNREDALVMQCIV